MRIAVLIAAAAAAAASAPPARAVIYTPAPDAPDRECWCINTATITNTIIEPHILAKIGLHE